MSNNEYEKRSNTFEIQIVLLLVAIYLIFEYYHSPTVLSTSYLLRILLIDLFAVVVFLCRTESYRNIRTQFVRIMPLFLIGFIIVHFQIYLDVIDGAYFSFGHDYLIDETIVSKACVISSCALVFFMLGYSRPRNNITKTHHKYEDLSERAYVYAILILFVVFVGTTEPEYFMGGYGPSEFGGIELSGISYYSNFYLVLFFLAYIVVRTYKLKYIYRVQVDGLLDYLKKLDRGVFALSVIYFVLILVSGDRGPIIQLSLGFGGSFVLLYRRKLPVFKTLLLLLVGIYVISYIAYIREFKETDSYLEKIVLAQETMATKKRNASISPGTVELAASVRTVHAAVSHVESNGLSYGIYQGVQIMGVIPGLGLYLSELLNLNLGDMKSGTFLTHLVLGVNPTHNVGTSSVADIYLDFGLLGTIFLFFWFGGLVRHLEISVFSEQASSIFLWTLFFLILSKSVYIGRSTILILLRDSVQLYLIIYMFSLIKSRKIT